MNAKILIALLCVCGVAHARQPTCQPDPPYVNKIHVEKLPSSASSTVGWVLIYACKTPTGYVNEVWGVTEAEIKAYVPLILAGTYKDADIASLCARTCETWRNDNSLVTAMRAISKP